MDSIDDESSKMVILGNAGIGVLSLNSKYTMSKEINMNNTGNDSLTIDNENKCYELGINISLICVDQNM